jgi:hypothetical protein
MLIDICSIQSNPGRKYFYDHFLKFGSNFILNFRDQAITA